MIKVSVIVATYCSGDGINRVVRSLDRQTLPQHEFEVIFVDDGSPDDTYQRLEKIRKTHDNVRITRIPNSGWPSKPRNTALEMAVGEYVLFMDHDDELSPDALRAAYELGHRNSADAVNPKESRTQFAGWAIDTFTQNLDNAIGKVSPNPLMPMNPHKLYRLKFLNEHNIRFPEGRRFIWEDIFFNIEVFKHAKVISLLSETAFYHWVKTGQNNSSSYGKDLDEFWGYLERIFDFIAQELADERHTDAREALLLHHFSGRVLNFFNDKFANRSDADIQLVLGHITRIMENHIPPEFDARLAKPERAKVYLLRLGRIDLLKQLCRVDIGVVGTSRAIDTAWADGRLRISALASWSGSATPSPDLVTVNGRILRNLPGEVVAALPPDLVDVTEEVEAASSQLAVRNRTDLSVWMQETTSRVNTAVDLNGKTSVTVVSEVLLDVDKAIFGRPMDAPLWDVNARNRVLSHLNQRMVRGNSGAAVALVHGRSAIAYTTVSGGLSLDLGQAVRTVIGSGGPAPAKASSRVDGKKALSYSIPLTRVSVFGDTALEGRVGLEPAAGLLGRVAASKRVAKNRAVHGLVRRLVRSRPVQIVGDENGARVEGTLPRKPGTYRLTFEFSGRLSKSNLLVSISSDGASFRTL